jgi:hypothetical protein
MEASLKTLSSMAEELGATTTVLRERDVGNGRTATEVLVRKVIIEVLLKKYILSFNLSACKDSLCYLK